MIYVYYIFILSIIKTLHFSLIVYEANRISVDRWTEFLFCGVLCLFDMLSVFYKFLIYVPIFTISNFVRFISVLPVTVSHAEYPVIIYLKLSRWFLRSFWVKYTTWAWFQKLERFRGTLQVYNYALWVWFLTWRNVISLFIPFLIICSLSFGLLYHYLYLLRRIICSRILCLACFIIHTAIWHFLRCSSSGGGVLHEVVRILCRITAVLYSSLVVQ